MLQTKFIQKIERNIFYSITFSKSYRLWDNVEKHGTATQATDGNIIRRMRFALWMTKTTDTLKIYNAFAFPLHQWLNEHVALLGYTYISNPVNFQEHLKLATGQQTIKNWCVGRPEVGDYVPHNPLVSVYPTTKAFTFIIKMYVFVSNK